MRPRRDDCDEVTITATAASSLLDNTIPGWNINAATLATVSTDARDGILAIANAGGFIAVYQTITTVPGTTYFVTFEAYAEPLGCLLQLAVHYRAPARQFASSTSAERFQSDKHAEHATGCFPSF